MSSQVIPALDFSGSGDWEMEGDVKDQLSDRGTRFGRLGTFPLRAVEAVEGDGAVGASGAGTFTFFPWLHLSSPPVPNIQARWEMHSLRTSNMPYAGNVWTQLDQH